MHLPLPLRHALVCAAAGLALASAFHVASAQSHSAAKPALVHGLIVQLRDAPSHVALARERASGRDAGTVTRESARWQRLVAELRSDASVQRELPAWASAAPQRDPVGASAQLLRFARPLTAEQAERVAARLAVRPEVAWVAANTREQRLATATNAPTDPYYPGFAGQWWLQLVRGLDTDPINSRLRGVPGYLNAWTSGIPGSTGSSMAVVAVLDTGITCHPDLGNMTSNCIGGAILPGYDMVANTAFSNDGDGRDADPRDPGDWVDADDHARDPVNYSSCINEPSSWHGTILAGMLAAQTNNNVGVAAMNWSGRVVPVRVAGKCGAEVADIVDGMRWAAGLPVCKTSDGVGGCAEPATVNLNPARIINISFGGSAACGMAYQTAIDELRAAGAVVVAAAGNGWGAPSRPASCTGVIGVGALNRDGFKSTYSNFGAALALSTVGGDDSDGAWGSRLADSGLLAVGNCGLKGPEIDCTRPNANTLPEVSWYYNHFGTSFSAPVVSGAVSLMLSVTPTLTVDQIITGLKVSARPHVTSRVPGFGECSNDNPGRCLCTTSTCGAGILDVDQALRYAANPGSYVNTLRSDELNTLELRWAVAMGPDRPANAPPPPPPSTGGGGGAMSAAWLLALALAAWALRRPVSASPPQPCRARSPRRAPRH